MSRLYRKQDNRCCLCRSITIHHYNAILFLVIFLILLYVCALEPLGAESAKVNQNVSMICSSPSDNAFDIRKRAGLSSTSFRVMEGSCTDGKYGYYALQKSKGDSCKIVKVFLSAIASSPDHAVVKVSEELFLGHANDMCYNSDTGEICVIHNVDEGTPSMRISIINPTSLKRTRTVCVRIPATLSGAKASQLKAVRGLCGIAYNSSTQQYVVLISGIYGHFLVLNKTFYPVRFICSEKRSPYVNQGIDCTGTSIFVGRSKGSGSNYLNIIEEYSWTGKYIKQYKTQGLKYEIESIYHIGNTFYITSYVCNPLLSQKYYAFLYKLSKSSAVTGLKIGSPTLIIRSGSQASLNASVVPLNASVRSIIYTSSKGHIATVSSTGTCYANSPGETTITMYTKQGYYTGQAKVIVVSTPLISRISNQNAGICLQWPSQAPSTLISVWRKNGKQAKGRYKRIAITRGNSYVDKKAKPGKFYCYRLSASNGSVSTPSSPKKSMWRLNTPRIKKLRSDQKNSVKVSWKPVKSASYYRIQYSTFSDFSRKKAVTVRGYSSRSVTLNRGLKSGKTYYIRIIACHKGAKKIYSQPSAAYTIKVK